MNHSIHHLRTYLIFLLVSLLLIGVLVYLYIPLRIDASKYLDSQAVAISSEPTVSAEVIRTEPVDPDAVAAKRMRLTALLLRYQKKLSQLESQETPASSDDVAIKASLRSKIEALEKDIAVLTQ